MRAEVLDKPFPDRPLIGLDLDALHHQSHHPRAVFGIGHFEVCAADGEAVVWLNWLRTQVREVELAAYEAFKPPPGSPQGQDPLRQTSPAPNRPDLMRALNRLSSALYVMVFRAKTGAYPATTDAA
jgi:ethanolamine utilization cobalamin adenosyltransferase